VVVHAVSSAESFGVQTDGGVEIWTLSFPPVNAIAPSFLDAVEARMREFEASEDVCVVIIRSGLRVFSAGADANWIAQVIATHGADALMARFKTTLDRLRAVCLAMRRSPVLFVAALEGHTLAGGLEYAAACDLRFAANDERIQIGVPEMKLFGVLPSGAGGSLYLARLMGASRALEFILRAEPCAPLEAYRLGLVDRLIEPGQVMAETESFARGLATRAGRVGINAAKRSILQGAELPLFDAMELDSAVHWDSMRRGGFLPGVSAFVARFGGGQPG
jgi:enoyl-CoA hydratase